MCPPCLLLAMFMWSSSVGGPFSSLEGFKAILFYEGRDFSLWNLFPTTSRMMKMISGSGFSKKDHAKNFQKSSILSSDTK
ncbi:hypothetical protein KP509_1Z061700 [Ceratopteris richardii]|nr:hypothetical protein KP509_1Z061700 [Ceratopteris richardii]